MLSAMEHSNERSARDLVSRLIDSFGARDEHGVVPFVRSWPEIVGRDLAAHSQVRDIRHGALILGVDHPAWMQRLHMDQDRILAQVQKRFPSLNVRFLQMIIVERLDSPWAGPAPAKDHPGAPETVAAGDEPPIPAPPVELPPEGQATQDAEFLAHLEGLGRALERRRKD